jgi:hypothetical protein
MDSLPVMRIAEENHEQRPLRRRTVDAFCEAMAGNIGSEVIGRPVHQSNEYLTVDIAGGVAGRSVLPVTTQCSMSTPAKTNRTRAHSLKPWLGTRVSFHYGAKIIEINGL